MQNNELMPANQDLKPYSSSFEVLQAAIQETKIATCENERLTEALRYAMITVGIRANNLPSQLEFDVLKNFVRRNFGGHSPSEIKLAFELATACRLDLEDAKAYENFSCEYLGRILAAYRRWASAQMKLAPTVTPPEKQLKAPDADWRELCNYHYQKFLTGKYAVALWPWQLYEEFEKYGFIYEGEYEHYLQAAKNRMADGYQKAHSFAGLLSEVMKEPAEVIVTNFAKRLAVEVLFEKEQAAGRQEFFILNS